MGFGKSLFDFVGYMSFFNPIGTGRASDSLEKQDNLQHIAQNCTSADEFAEKCADQFDCEENAKDFWENS